MQVFVIRPHQHLIESMELLGGLEGIKAIIGYDTIAADLIDAEGNTLYFDEDCFLRAEVKQQRFQVNTLAPVAGIGVVVKSSLAEGAFETPSFSRETLQSHVKFIT